MIAATYARTVRRPATRLGYTAAGIMLLSLPAAAWWFVSAGPDSTASDTMQATPPHADAAAVPVVVAAITPQQSGAPATAAAPAAGTAGTGSDAADTDEVPAAEITPAAVVAAQAYTMAGEEAPHDADPFALPRAADGHLYITNEGDRIIISSATPAASPRAAEVLGEAGDTLDHPAGTADPGLTDSDQVVWITPECPNSLPSGSSYRDADLMQQTYGCNYRSACYAVPEPGSEACTFYFMGFTRS